MSDSQPTGPEMLGDATPPSRGRRRWGIAAAAAAGVVVVGGAATWAALALLPSGEQPAVAVPADAVAYVSVDLDPSAGQKIAALDMLKKFPALDEQLDLDSRDDLRRWVFEQVKDSGACPDLDYARDVEPWLGNRVAVAAVPGPHDSVLPAVAVQVGDQGAARDGVDALAACDGSDGNAGVAFVGEYMVLSDTDQHAERIAADAAEAPLDTDEGFQRWTGEVGDPGIVTIYVSADAPRYLSQLEQGLVTPGVTRTAAGDTEELYEDFEGMAATIRFEDGAVAMEFAAKGMPDGSPAADAGATSIGELPASTGAAFSVALSDGWLRDYLKSMNEAFGDGASLDQMLTEAEQATGLDLPEDVEALLGDGFSVSFDAEADFEKIVHSEDPTLVPFGVRVSGDPDGILPVVDKLKAAVGPDADMVAVESGDGVVAFSLRPTYAETLADEGSLGGQAVFTSVVPEADRASGVFYVNFDAGDGWAEQLAQLAADEMAAGGGDELDLVANVAPLDALGISSWTDGDVQRGLFRLTTD